MKPFKFKYFTVEHDQCAMKVGTDGVMLAAWTTLKNEPASILDVGTGTGLISLMMAQRSEAPLIDALEIDPDAFEQAVMNFENSPWGDRLFCYHASFNDFVTEMKEEPPYDLIISNPPFYKEGFSSGDTKRDQARFSSALPVEELIAGANQLLSGDGCFSTIIPKRLEKELISIAQEHSLFPQRLTRVKGNPNSEIKRCLFEFGRKRKNFTPAELVIEYSRHEYTPEFKELVRDFYLKL